MESHKKAMDSSKETCELLEKLSRDITETLNKIESRESYMNRALDVDINEYSMKNAQLTEVRLSIIIAPLPRRRPGLVTKLITHKHSDSSICRGYNKKGY